MSRSGYCDDGDEDIPVQLYRQAVRRAITGYRGQHLLRRLRDALDAMPTKRLITDAIKDDSGDVCALGALDPNAADLAKHFRVAPALTSEVVYMNDEATSWRTPNETPEERWVRMRAWVDSQILAPQTDTTR